MQYNPLLRWFVGLGIDDAVWVPTVFTKNRDRLMTTQMSRKVLSAILAHREVVPLLSDDHFSVAGTLVTAWASMKSFQPKAGDTPPDDDPGSPPGSEGAAEDPLEPTETETAPMPRPTRQKSNAEVDFRGEKRSNATYIRVPREPTRSTPCISPSSTASRTERSSCAMNSAAGTSLPPNWTRAQLLACAAFGATLMKPPFKGLISDALFASLCVIGHNIRRIPAQRSLTSLDNRHTIVRHQCIRTEASEIHNCVIALFRPNEI
jgi:hypothetical protein